MPVASEVMQTTNEGPVPHPDDDHPLSPVLSHTEVQLQAALDEVCETVAVDQTATDELIRMEEMLAIAADAAKRTISLRQRIDADQGGAQPLA